MEKKLPTDRLQGVFLDLTRQSFGRDTWLTC